MMWNHARRRAAHPNRETLHAYVDRELGERERLAVEEALQADPAAADYVARCRSLRRDLHAICDDAFHAPLPPRLVELGCAIQRTRTTRRTPWYRQMLVVPLRLATAAAVAIGLATSGWLALSAGLQGERTPGDLFALLGSGPGLEAAAPEDGLGLASAESGALDPGAAADGTEGAPDLQDFGFGLVGARMLAAADGPSMQLTYQDADGRRVELYYAPAQGEGSQLTLMEDGPVKVLVWRGAGRSYSLVGELDREVMLEMGRAVDSQWTGASTAPPAEGDAADGADAAAGGEDGLVPAEGDIVTEPAEPAEPGVPGEDSAET